MKIIFLDFEGVLIPYNFMYLKIMTRNFESIQTHVDFKNQFLKSKIKDKYGLLFDSNSVGYLDLLIQSTDAKIVVISDWRRMGLKLLRKMWKYRKLPGEIIGMTGVNNKDKSVQIKNYLNENEDIDTYVVIDNDELLEVPQHHYVFINSYVGIGKQDYIMAFKILTR